MPLDLATKIAAVKKPKPTNFEAWLETLDAEDRQALDNARHDPEVTNVDLHAILKDAGLRVSEKTIARWRRGRDQ